MSVRTAVITALALALIAGIAVAGWMVLSGGGDQDGAVGESLPLIRSLTTAQSSSTFTQEAVAAAYREAAEHLAAGTRQLPVHRTGPR